MAARYSSLTILLLGFLACHPPEQSKEALQSAIQSRIAGVRGEFAIAFLDPDRKDSLMIHEHEIFHAASTMKTPVMIEVFRRGKSGRFSLDDSLPVTNYFKSIADSSHYNLNPEDDSEKELYRKTGVRLPIRELVYLMITQSSNLATNLLIDLVTPDSVAHTLQGLGIKDLKVIRGVEDNKAYQLGMNNVVTAYDLLVIFNKMAAMELVDDSSSRAMIRILKDQQFREIIPARLPPGLPIAHKTGWFKSVNHDGGIIYLPDGRKYILVLLSKNVAVDEEATQALADISGLVYQYELSKR